MASQLPTSYINLRSLACSTTTDTFVFKSLQLASVIDEA